MATVQTGSVLERTVLKEGPIFLVADRAGDVKALNLDGHGLYYRDTRFLSLFEMDIPGTRLTLLSATGELNFMNNLQFANDTMLGADEYPIRPIAGMGHHHWPQRRRFAFVVFVFPPLPLQIGKRDLSVQRQRCLVHFPAGDGGGDGG